MEIEPIIPLFGIQEEVEKKLQKDQESKAFKDVGERVQGSRKERAAIKSLIRSTDLVNLEKDAVTAAELVKKEKIWPKIDPEKELDRGVSSGATYLKTELRKAFPAKPKLRTPEARKMYVLFAEILMEGFDKCYTVLDLKTFSTIVHKYDPSELPFLFLEEGEDELSSSQLDDIYSQYHVRKLIELYFGKTFFNLFYQKKRSSKSVKAKWNNAMRFEGVTAEQAAQNLIAHNQRIDGQIKTAKERIKMYRAFTSTELKEQQRNWRNVSRNLDEFRTQVINYFKRQLKRAEEAENNLPEDQKEQEPDWSWTNAKRQSSGGEKTGLTINSGKPLTHIKRTGGLEIASVTEHEIMRLFGFRYVEFGKWVKDEEARAHVRHFLGAIADLFEVLNFNAIQTNQMNDLSISFGSRGRGTSSASYFPARKIINITKSRGDGTVAHEWAHFLDNLIYNEIGHGISTEHLLATETIRRLPAGKIQKTLAAIFQFFNKGSGKPFVIKKTFFAQDEYSYLVLEGVKTLEEGINRIRERYPSYLKDAVGARKRRDTKLLFGNLAKRINQRHIEVELEVDYTSQYLYYSSQMKSKYWREPVELFARAFETYIFDKLDKAGRTNNYLVSGGDFDTSFNIYPIGKEREQLYTLYDNFMVAVKEELGIKDFEPFTTRRTDEYIEFDLSSHEEKVKSGLIVSSTFPKLLLLELQLLKLAS